MFMLQLEESLVSFALVPLFSRTSIRHKHGDSQHGVQLGFHHKDALHQRGRDLSGFRVGGRGRWAFRDAFHQAKRNIFDFGDAPIGKSVSNQIRVGCCIPIRDRIFILVALLWSVLFIWLSCVLFLLFYVYLALEVKKKRQVSLLVSSCPNGLVVRCPLSSLRNLELIPNQTLFPERQLAGFSMRRWLLLIFSSGRGQRWRTDFSHLGVATKFMTLTLSYRLLSCLEKRKHFQLECCPCDLTSSSSRPDLRLTLLQESIALFRRGRGLEQRRTSCGRLWGPAANRRTAGRPRPPRTPTLWSGRTTLWAPVRRTIQTWNSKGLSTPSWTLPPRPCRTAASTQTSRTDSVQHQRRHLPRHIAGHQLSVASSSRRTRVTRSS